MKSDRKSARWWVVFISLGLGLLLSSAPPPLGSNVFAQEETSAEGAATEESASEESPANASPRARRRARVRRARARRREHRARRAEAVRERRRRARERRQARRHRRHRTPEAEAPVAEAPVAEAPQSAAEEESNVAAEAATDDESEAAAEPTRRRNRRRRRRRARGASPQVASPQVASPQVATPEAAASHVSPTPASPRPRAQSDHASMTAGMGCSACHTPEGWAMSGTGGGFDHARTGFPLRGVHTSTGCGSCHRPQQTLASDCGCCHQDNHQGRLGDRCESCHNEESWQESDALAMHRRTRLPLTGMHALAACTDCHQRVGDREFSAVPADCFSCHGPLIADPSIHPNHQGTGASAAFDRDCSSCHRTTAWSPAIVDLSTLPARAPLLAAPSHEVRFPLTTGAHRGLDCASCHRDVRSPQELRCIGCHAHSPTRLRSQHGNTPLSLSARSCLGCHPGGVAR